MKKILLNITFSVLFIFLAVVPETNAVFKSSAKMTSGNFTSGIKTDFYYRDDKKALGFNICGINSYDRLEYLLTYQHDSILEGAGGSKLTNYENCVKEEWIILGLESQGSYHYFENVTGIKLNVDLFNTGVKQTSLLKTLD